MKTIDLAKEFSVYPAGRTAEDGQFNGTRFREEILGPAFADASPDEQIIVDIDGVRTFGSSFLEESFGGLIRLGLVTKSAMLNRLVIRCSKPHLMFFKDAIWQIVNTSRPAT